MLSRLIWTKLKVRVSRAKLMPWRAYLAGECVRSSTKKCSCLCLMNLIRLGGSIKSRNGFTYSTSPTTVKPSGTKTLHLRNSALKCRSGIKRSSNRPQTLWSSSTQPDCWRLLVMMRPSTSVWSSWTRGSTCILTPCPDLNLRSRQRANWTKTLNAAARSWQRQISWKWNLLLSRKTARWVNWHTLWMLWEGSKGVPCSSKSLPISWVSATTTETERKWWTTILCISVGSRSPQFPKRNQLSSHQYHRSWTTLMRRISMMRMLPCQTPTSWKMNWSRCAHHPNRILLYLRSNRHRATAE